MKILYLSIITALGIGAIVSFGMVFFLNPQLMGLPVQQSSNQKQASQDLSSYQMIKKYMPGQLTPRQLFQAEEIALSDSKVKSMIGGKPVSLMSHSFFGNLRTDPGVWYPQLNFNVNNKTQLVVVVDLSAKKVTKVLVGAPIGTCFCPDDIPSASMGKRTAEVATKLYSNSSMPGNVHYLWLRFLDANTNQTLKHVSFFLTFAQNNDTLFRELLHTHTGILTLQVNSVSTPFNGTVFAADREPVLNGWVPHDDNEPILVYAPLFNDDNSTYHMNIVMHSVDIDNNIFNSDVAPRFNSYIGMKEPDQILVATLKNQTSPAKASSGNLQVLEGNGTFAGFKINYTITGNGSMLGASLDRHAQELTLSLKTQSRSTLKVTIPRALLDARINNQDAQFIVLVNGIEWHYTETKTSADRTLTITFNAGATKIEIAGVQYV